MRIILETALIFPSPEPRTTSPSSQHSIFLLPGDITLRLCPGCLGWHRDMSDRALVELCTQHLGDMPHPCAESLSCPSGISPNPQHVVGGTVVRRSLSDHYLLPLSTCDLCFYASLEMEASLVSPRVLRIFQAPGNRGPYPARQALLMMEKSLTHSMPHLPEIGPPSQDLGLGLPGRCCLFLLGRESPL